ncbi:MAG TPA: chromosomal replication initiator protein DnaA [Candidatus Bathyarchaeia archaeon]|nr:chromosomal replication initiator protein DnaA [Candidatus Bathyarchaeia archaeon]
MINKKELWQTVLAELQLSLSRTNFSAWFNNTSVLQVKKIGSKRQLVELAVVNPYTKDTIEQRYLGQIQEILDRVTKTSNEVRIVVQTPKPIVKKEESGPLFSTDFEKERQAALDKAIRASRLNPAFTFGNFAVSSTNEMAHAAALAVAKNPGKTYHLLFLYGGVGVGKTHLSHAIGHQVLENDLHAPVIYCTSEDFTNGIVEAIKTRSTREFRQKFRTAKVLLIDDIQFIAGKETIQEEFFHTFNAIHAEGGQIILTSDCPPHEIEGIEDRLRSRFEGGLTIDVQEPNFELRTAILLIKAKQGGKILPMDVAQLIAGNIKSTRRLEGFLTKLINFSETKKEPITPQLCQSLLGEIPSQPINQRQLIKPKEILQTVAEFYNLNPTQLKGSKRAKPIVFPRQIAMYLIRTELKTPLMEVGYLFGGRDHTTVMHSVNKITKTIAISEEVRLDIESLKKRLYGL